MGARPCFAVPLPRPRFAGMVGGTKKSSVFKVLSNDKDDVVEERDVQYG